MHSRLVEVGFTCNLAFHLGPTWLEPDDPAEPDVCPTLPLVRVPRRRWRCSRLFLHRSDRMQSKCGRQQKGAIVTHLSHGVTNRVIAGPGSLRTARRAPGARQLRVPERVPKDATALVIDQHREIADVARERGVVEEPLGNSVRPVSHVATHDNWEPLLHLWDM